MLRKEFPGLVSYTIFVTICQAVIVQMYCLMHSFIGEKTGVYFTDSTSLKVCNLGREKRHRVFKGLAAKGYTSMGWFFGFKLNLIVNNKREIMAFEILGGNIHDKNVIEILSKNLKGKIVGDKGYIDKKLTENLWVRELMLITKLRKNMKNKLISLEDKYYVNHR